MLQRVPVARCVSAPWSGRVTAPRAPGWMLQGSDSFGAVNACDDSRRSKVKRWSTRRSAGLAGPDHLDRLGDPAVPGLGLPRLGDPAHVLLAVRVREGGERLVDAAGLEGLGDVRGDVDGALAGVDLDDDRVRPADLD